MPMPAGKQLPFCNLSRNEAAPGDAAMMDAGALLTLSQMVV